MATAEYGLAKLDLSGNRIIWDASDTNHSTILLDGSHFHHVVPMATLAVSSLCLLSFVGILISVCCVCCGHRDASKFLPYATVWVPIFCMISFFVIDIANRVFHELQYKWPTEYIGIDIPLGSMASIADGLLMIYLLNHSPVDVAHGGPFIGLVMGFAVVVFFIISTASKGTQIWNLLSQNAADDGTNSDGDKDDPLTKSLGIFQDLDATASGMLLLFAIGFALLSARFIQHLSKTQKLRKRLSFVIIILAASFFMRNLVKFVFTLIYSQFNKVAYLGTQLIYMIFYGLLSVVIFGCIVAIAAVQEKAYPLTNQTNNGPVAQMAVNEQEANWDRYQTKSNVTTDGYLTSRGYDPNSCHGRSQS